ncbi:MAG TPA: hypothetical protein VMD27_02210 [Candidatus Aquilonibacter sp.]|nr:hypothetical protein [Candidatus Aquilonibacter sp.]
MDCYHLNGIARQKSSADLDFTVKEGNFNGGTLQALSGGMKTNTKIIGLMTGIASLAALPLMARPAIAIQIGVPAPPPPTVIVQAPVPAVAVTVGVPDTYVWDGTEYVGMVGDQYYYLGPGNVWIVCNPVRLARFHAWVKIHPDWRVHATVNMKYRLDAQGHAHPRTDAATPDKKDHNHGH